TLQFGHPPCELALTAGGSHSSFEGSLENRSRFRPGTGGASAFATQCTIGRNKPGWIGTKMNWVERTHELHVHPRRVRVLAEAAARMLPPNLDVLDIGCGDGRLGAEVSR